MQNLITLFLSVSFASFAHTPGPSGVAPQKTPPTGKVSVRTAPSPKNKSLKGSKAQAQRFTKRQGPGPIVLRSTGARDFGPRPYVPASSLAIASVGLGLTTVGFALYGLSRRGSGPRDDFLKPDLPNAEPLKPDLPNAHTLEADLLNAQCYRARVTLLRHGINAEIMNQPENLERILKPLMESSDNVSRAFVAAYLTHFIITHHWAFKIGNSNLDVWRRRTAGNAGHYFSPRMKLTSDAARRYGVSCKQGLFEDQIINPDSLAYRYQGFCEKLCLGENQKQVETLNDLMIRLAFYESIASESAQEYWELVYNKAYIKVPEDRRAPREARDIVRHLKNLDRMHSHIPVETRALIDLFGPDGRLTPEGILKKIIATSP